MTAAIIPVCATNQAFELLDNPPSSVIIAKLS